MSQELEPEIKALWQQLNTLQQHLRHHSKIRFNRLNPFYEDLFDWKEKGEFWCQTNKNITIYQSVTLIGDVEIGDHTWIGPYCMLDGTGGLTIGRYCSIAQGSQLLTHDSIRWALSGGKAQYDYAKTTIGNYCFLGVNTVVTKGVTIGQHCLIAAGAVITKDVADYSIMAGVPAQRMGNVEVTDQGDVTLHYF